MGAGGVNMASTNRCKLILYVRPYDTKSLFKSNLPQVQYSQFQLSKDHDLVTLKLVTYSCHQPPSSVRPSHKLPLGDFPSSSKLGSLAAAMTYQTVSFGKCRGTKNLWATRYLTYTRIHHISFLMVYDLSAYSTSYTPYDNYYSKTVHIC